MCVWGTGGVGTGTVNCTKLRQTKFCSTLGIILSFSAGIEIDDDDDAGNKEITYGTLLLTSTCACAHKFRYKIYTLSRLSCTCIFPIISWFRFDLFRFQSLCRMARTASVPEFVYNLRMNWRLITDRQCGTRICRTSYDDAKRFRYSMRLSLSLSLSSLFLTIKLCSA